MTIERYNTRIMPPTTFSQRLIDDAGPVDGYWHIAPTLLSSPSTLRGDKFDQVFKYEPWSHKSTQNMLEHHPVAVWRDLTVHVSSQAGVFGRMVEFYGGWSAEGATSPTSVQEMAQLRGAFSRVVGGSADPGVLRASIPCEFDGTVSDALKAQYNSGVRAVFYYCFTEIEVVSSPPKAPRIKLEFVGKYDVFGNFGR